MRIRLEPEVALRLETYCLQARGLEVSGFGWVRIEGEEFVVYDACLMDVGSQAYTEIKSQKMLPLMTRPDAGRLKLWWHVHPIGSGVPGSHNWSGTDENTARNEPLGSTPDWVMWALAIVRTPHGWVGRYDTFGPKGTTVHLEVTPNFAQGADQELAAIYAEKGQQPWSGLRVVGPERATGMASDGAEWDDLFYLTPEEVEEFNEDIALDDDEFSEKWVQDADGFYHRIYRNTRQMTLNEAVEGQPFWKKFFRRKVSTRGVWEYSDHER